MPTNVRFSYDATGINPDNLINGEVHALSLHSVRAVAPVYGPFFSASVQVFDNGTDQILTRGVDYQLVEMLEDITLRLGKEVCNLILILNTNVSSNVRLNYQVVGGMYQNDASSLINMYETVLLDNRPVAWENVLSKPLAFPPTTHLHNLQDVYGFEPLVGALERVRNAIVLSDIPAFEALIDWVSGLTADTNVTVNNMTSTLTIITSDISNETTARIAGDNAESAARIAGDNALNAAKQDNLGFTPVQQGTGVGQGTNVVKIGWSAGSRLKATVDATDLGNLVFDSQLGAYLSLGGGVLTGLLTGTTSSMSMTQDNGATKGSFVARASGVGDSNLAGMTFWNDAYAIKLGIRADGYFGLGGWSRTAWSWYSAANGDMVAAGNVSAYSDPRLKDNVCLITDPLAICRALDGVTFNWNTRSNLVANKAGKRDYGVLADQVKLVMPEIISQSIPDEETKEVFDLVAYEKLVPVLLEAIKILEQRVIILETKTSG